MVLTRLSNSLWRKVIKHYHFLTLMLTKMKKCYGWTYTQSLQTQRDMSHFPEQPFKIKDRLNCDSSNLIYLLKCKGCNEEYIGQTGRTIRDRLVLYRQHINQPQYCTIFVEKHLRSCGNKQFSICPFFKLKNSDKNIRESHELGFIEQLKPSLNRRI